MDRRMVALSGGSWDYAYSRVEDVAGRLLLDRSVKRRALGRHLQDVAAALRAIEWHDSGDTSGVDEPAAIMCCIGPQQELAALRDEVTALRAALDEIEERLR